MTTMTRQMTAFAGTQHHMATRSAFVVLFWAVAALLVGIAHRELDPVSPSAGALVAMAALILMAFVYMRFVAPQPTVDHALGVGIAWLVLVIVTEMAMTSYLGKGWFGLLGSPDWPLVRNIFLFIWIFAPALFVQYRNAPENERP